jgi:hypothetical protein
MMWGSQLQDTPLRYSMVLSLIPDSGKSGMGMGMDPPSPANRGWAWGWTPDPRQIGDGTPIPIPGQIGDGDGDGDRGFRALERTPRARFYRQRPSVFSPECTFPLPASEPISVWTSRRRLAARRRPKAARPQLQFTVTAPFKSKLPAKHLVATVRGKQLEPRPRSSKLTFNK